VIGLNPGATQERKRWPEERFAVLGDQLAAEWGCRVAIFGGPGDEDLADRILRSMESPAINLAGRLRLGETAAALRRCEIVISNDTGPLHMASALGVPVVGLFGPTSPNQFGPRGARHAVLRAPTRCPHCPHSCMHTIAVEDCFAAASHLLQEAGVRV
jgi:ADP-heptose:LPS heptosyltransferase